MQGEVVLGSATDKRHRGPAQSQPVRQGAVAGVPFGVTTAMAGEMNDHAATADVLLDADRRHLIHPLHHPKEHAQAHIFVEGRGAMLHTADGGEYIDTGLSAL